MSGRILIVDDDVGFARSIERTLRRAGHDVFRCETGAEARKMFLQHHPEVVVLDYQLPDADGLALLDELKRAHSAAVFLMATAYPDLETAVDAMRRGAFDYVAKEADPRECILRVERGAEVAALRRRVAEAETVASGEEESTMLGASAPMVALRARLDAVRAADETTVLITGETGTGKGVLARLLHHRSGRSFEPFVAVDCTTIAPTLAESELFGHERGAFSGAAQAKMGRVEAAGTGTLFLDEIGELPLTMQAKLLRLLEEKEFTRVGGTRPRALKARIIAATNRNLGRAVKEGWFRADLRYRLEVFVLDVPPLRERGEDIVLLATHFAGDRARSLGRPAPRLAPALAERLHRYPFPGNVRELRNMVEQAILLMQGDTLELHDFPVLERPETTSWEPPGKGDAQRPAQGSEDSYAATRPIKQLPSNPHQPPGDPAAETGNPGTLTDIRDQFQASERQQLLSALAQTGGNVSAAARLMRMSRYQVLRRMRKYALR